MQYSRLSAVSEYALQKPQNGGENLKMTPKTGIESNATSEIGIAVPPLYKMLENELKKQKTDKFLVLYENPKILCVEIEKLEFRFGVSDSILQDYDARTRPDWH